jgi:hypothetical protein
MLKMICLTFFVIGMHIGMFICWKAGIPLHENFLYFHLPVMGIWGISMGIFVGNRRTIDWSQAKAPIVIPFFW